MSEQERITLGSIVGSSFDDEFLKFDLTDIQNILSSLANAEAIDIAHAELFQQQSLRGADILSEFLGRLVKVTSYLEAKVNSVKNKVSLDYKSPDGKTTGEMKKAAGEASPEVEELQIKLAKAKGSKLIIEKKYDNLIRLHYHYKEIASGMRKSIIIGEPNKTSSSGWE